MIDSSFLFFVMSIYVKTTSSFNVDTSSDSSKLVRPYSIGTNQQITNPLFFGYDINIRNSSGTTLSTLTAGAPKRITTSNNELPQSGTPAVNTEGDIFTCAVPTSFRLFSRPTICSSSSLPAGAGKGDAFGLTVDSSNSGGVLVTCSPTKLQVCGVANETIRLPGYCYQKQTSGGTWQADAQTLNLRCPVQNRDIIFMIDGSGSVGRANFRTIQQWIINLAKNFNINNGTNRIGVIQYSHYQRNKPLDQQEYIRTEIALTQYNDQSQLNRAINRIKYLNFTTYTAAALRKSIQDFNSSDRFRDPNTAKVLILLTDGNSTDYQYLARDARKVRNLGITTFAVGVGEAVVSQLRTVATGDVNSGRRVFFVNNFNGLAAITQQLALEISNVNLEGTQTGNQNNEFAYGEYGFSIKTSPSINSGR